MKKYAVLLVLLAALIAVVPTFAGDDVFCSEFGIVEPIPVQQVPGSDGRLVNWVPSGNYNADILVDTDCYISSGANVTGNVIETGDTDWSIFIDAGASINGDIEEKGQGSVFFNIGHLGVHNGNIMEKGPGQIWVWVDGFFNGNVEEKGPGSVTVDVFGEFPSGGPGTFNGNAVEKGPGDGSLSIEALGEYNGNFTEQQQGMCYARIELPAQQPNLNIECSSVEYLDW